MADIVVCGGSIIGLSTAMMLAADGHRVTVFEADGSASPADAAQAWDAWDRNGVAQFRQPHNLFARARAVFDAELPGITDDMAAAGCVWVDPLDWAPPFEGGLERRPEDDRLRFITGRRPVIEAVVARAAQRRQGLTVHRGSSVEGLLVDTAGDGPPHVRGVRLADGTEVAADLVVDAMGRRTKLGEWLTAALGVVPPMDSEDSGFVYHTRYFTGPNLPVVFGPIAAEIGTITVLTLPGDNSTWSVTVWAAAADSELRGLKDPQRWEAVVRACPLQAHWLNGEPTTDVLTMAGIMDRYRRFVIDGEPIATGVVAVGDAWACTNPSAGRGISVGLAHAQALRGVVRQGLDDPRALALRFDAITQETVAPFFHNQVAADRRRLATMDALRAGAEPPPPDPLMTAVQGAMLRHPDVFRGVMEIVMCLSLPSEVFTRPAIRDAMATVAALGSQPPMTLPGPDRRQLLELVG